MKDLNKRIVLSISIPAWMAEAVRAEAQTRSIGVSALIKEYIVEAMTGGKEHGRQQEERTANTRDQGDEGR